jgi:saccharopine dehydrogenase-like NADP-dependent oxidoreductase
MKKILLIGAGLSSSSLIEYLLNNSEKFDWKITVGDMSEELAKFKVKGHKNARPIGFDIFNETQTKEEIKNHDLVVSMLPAAMHPKVAKVCLEFKKHMVTASYVSDEMKALCEDVKKAGIIFMNEIGVDPGIDHMSTMQALEKIKAQGGEVFLYKSFTGGLIAPKYDNNPCNYKFTWNPRNVVVAGQGTAKFLEDGEFKYIPYHNLFISYNRFTVLNYGEFEGYPNRDSLKYRSLYGLDKVETMVRGTLRRPGFCKMWDVFVQLGMTDDTYTIENSENMTFREFTDAFLYSNPVETTEQRLSNFIGIDDDSNTMYRLRWLGLFGNDKIGLKNATPAQILQKLLVEKWKFEDGDRDMIVMQHQFGYKVNGKQKLLKSSLAVEGKDNLNTAMSITVGIPVAIAVKLILTGVINIPGVHVPVIKEIYEPVLNELKEWGIEFIEEEE